MKNILKSIFISSFPVLALFILVRTSINLTKESLQLHHIGALISSFMVVFFFSMLFIKTQARTSRALLPITIPITISFLFTIINFKQEYFIYSAIILICWVLYLTWYSTFQKRDTAILQKGKTLPFFSFQNGEKKTISTKNFSGDFSIYMFYRGNWCPLCMAQIREVVYKYKELAKRNVNMFLVSSQPHKFTQDLTEKHNVPFQFLVDVDNTVAKQIGIYHKNGLPTGFQTLGYDSDVVMPTIIITDKNNKIIFADLTDNYRVRPEPETFLKIIDTYKDSVY